jgi:hypothetical protein
MRRGSTTRRAAVRLAALVACTARLATPTSAQIAPGSTLVFSGTADVTDVGSPGVLLDFARHVTADPSANTGAFAVLNGRGDGGAKGNVAPMVAGNGPQPIRRLLQIGGYTFDLAVVPSGVYGQDECYVEPAVGQRCTPYQFPSFALSPFVLENVASGTPDRPFDALVSFRLTGTVTGHGTTSDFVGTITTTFPGVSFQEALAGLEQNGLRDVPFTGTFVAGAR